MDPLNYILQEEVLELYIMRVATEHNEKTILNNEVNPLAQILPIFKWDLKLLLTPITQTDDINYRNEMQHKYNDYQIMLTQLKETGKCEVMKDSKIFTENRLLIPFHLSQSEQLKSELQPFISLIIEQSHAFKIVHMVLNLIFHNYQESSASCMMDQLVEKLPLTCHQHTLQYFILMQMLCLLWFRIFNLWISL
ncbi:Hypothetical_protein [Hexamita inflata]|uniref:Hypothetical_protein n=1 Tax=Hexamita inflata TaxID=28002 RepID=A0AA86UXF6_9EUKA|nr:Hypothetical protein HINF_LOCUS39618 [Hexamita inflata]